MNESDLLSVIQTTLSLTCDSICRSNGLERSEVYERTESYIQENSAEWRKPIPIIDYRNPFCRMAYIYMNVAMHSHLISRTFEAFSSFLKGNFSSGKEVRICAFGGGPGSELLGVVNFADTVGSIDLGTAIDFLLIDYVKEWDESWHSLKQGVDQHFRKIYGEDWREWPIMVNRSFLPLDVTNFSDFANFPTRFIDTDIYMFSYLISELLENLQPFSKVVRHLAEQAKPDSYFVFIDRNQTRVTRTIRQIIEDCKLSSLDESMSRGSVEFDLKKLGEWYINLPTLPRTKFQTYSSIASRK